MKAHNIPDTVYKIHEIVVVEKSVFSKDFFQVMSYHYVVAHFPLGNVLVGQSTHQSFEF